MPKIPLYNQGAGNVVEAPAGTLGPRAAMGAFEAPGKAVAGLARTASDIAFKFGMAEKEAETIQVYNELSAQYAPQVDDLINNPQSRTVAGFDIEAGAFTNDALSAVDARKDLTKNQRLSIRSNLQKDFARKISIGRTQVFAKQQNDRTNIMADSIGNLINDAANKKTRPTVLTDIQKLLDSSKEQGLGITMTMDDVLYEIEKRDILADSTNDALPLEYFTEKREKILNGEDGYGRYTASQRESLAASVAKRESYLRNGAVAEVKSEGADVLASIALTGDGTGARRIAGRMKELGLFAEAEQFQSDALIETKLFNIFDRIKLASPQEVNDALVMAKKVAETGPISERAENAVVAQQLNKRVMEMRDQIVEDPVAYSEAVEGRALSVSERIERQKLLGIPERDIVPFRMDEFTQFTEILSTADPVSAMREMDAFFTKYGDAGLRGAMRNGMGYAYNIAYFNKNHPKSIDLLGAMQIDEATLKAQLKSVDITAEEIDVAVKDELEDWSRSVIGGTSDGVLSRMGGPARYAAVIQTEKAVSRLAKVYVTRGMDAEDAAIAAADLITGRYVFSEVNDMQVRIPSSFARSAPEIMAWLDSRMNDDRYLEGTVALDAAGLAAPEDEVAQYIREIRDMGGWVTMPNDEGVYLVDKFGNRVMKRVPVDGVMMEQPIIILFSDIVDAIDVIERYGIGEAEIPAEAAQQRMEELRLR